eukprot:766928-Hanusia_phi.AAC.2
MKEVKHSRKKCRAHDDAWSRPRKSSGWTLRRSSWWELCEVDVDIMQCEQEYLGTIATSMRGSSPITGDFL